MWTQPSQQVTVPVVAATISDQIDAVSEVMQSSTERIHLKRTGGNPTET